VLEVFHEGDRPDVQVAPDQLGAELLRSVLGQLQVEQGTRPGEAPIKGDAVQELDVPDSGAGGSAGGIRRRFIHIRRLVPALVDLAPGAS
jgi:hypothetical protein